jgi:hypothetical protein
MTHRIIKLAKLMISYGFYRTKDELREISIALISLLNGVNDIYDLHADDMSDGDNVESFKRIKSGGQHLNHDSQRYQKNKSNLIIMKCKEEICETLLRILEIENDLMMSMFLGFFKDGIESTLLMDIPEEDEDGQFEGQVNTSKVFPKEGRGKNQNEDHSKALLSQSPKSNGAGMNDEETIKWIEKVLMGEQLFDAFSQKTYVCILLDLLAYNHLSLNNKAFDLLMKFFSQRANIVDLLKQVQLLEQPESIKILKKATKYSSELKTFIEMINQWVDDGTNNFSSHGHL